MKYIVYQTVNMKDSVNGSPRMLFGVHACENPEIFDGYLGESCHVGQPATYMYPKTPFQYAVKKYGVEAFRRFTITVYDTANEAYEKLGQILDAKTVKQAHLYNARHGGPSPAERTRIRQFSSDGRKRKEWKSVLDASEFYGIPAPRFVFAARSGCQLLNSYWSFGNSMNPSNIRMEVFHCFLPSGKWICEFYSAADAAQFLNVTEQDIREAVKNQRPLPNGRYITNKCTDLFVPKPRRQYNKGHFFVYKENGEFLGEYEGKAVMKVIGMHSWAKISIAMKDYGGWYKDFFMSEVPVDHVPERKKGTPIMVDVYDKWGNFIETLSSVREVREKYNVPSARIKDIQKGDRYYGDWIFRYKHSK